MKVKDLYVGALIRADFLCSYNDNEWHTVYQVDVKANKVYLAVEGFGGIELPLNYDVEVK